MSRKGDLQELETEVLRHMPADVMQALQRSDRREPLLKHLVQSSITRFVTDIDRRTLEVLTAKIVSGTAAVKAATEARRAVHELSQVDQKLAQEAELRDLQHETARLAEDVKQEKLRFRGLHWKQRTAHRGWLERELGKENSAEPAKDVWRAYLETFGGNLMAAENLRLQTDSLLADYRKRQQAEIADDDPARERKMAEIEASVEDLRSRRDEMMRDAWGRSRDR